MNLSTQLEWKRTKNLNFKFVKTLEDIEEFNTYDKFKYSLKIDAYERTFLYEDVDFIKTNLYEFSKFPMTYNGRRLYNYYKRMFFNTSYLTFYRENLNIFLEKLINLQLI